MRGRYVCGGGVALAVVLGWERSVDCIALTLDAARRRAESARRAKFIILVRHGESEGNIDKSLYAVVGDPQIALTDLGKDQAIAAGLVVRDIVGEGKVVPYVSPFRRSWQTWERIRRALDPDKVDPPVLDPLLREQEFGNLQHPYKKAHEEEHERRLVGRLWYRYNTGESAADVFLRATSFVTNLLQEMKDICGPEDSVVIVSHGVTLRLIMMSYFHWSPETWESVYNPGNCDVWVLENDGTGQYNLSGVSGQRPRSERQAVVKLRSQEQPIVMTIYDYLTIPQPRTSHKEHAIHRLGLDPHDVESIEYARLFQD